MESLLDYLIHTLTDAGPGRVVIIWLHCEGLEVKSLGAVPPGRLAMGEEHSGLTGCFCACRSSA